MQKHNKTENAKKALKEIGDLFGLGEKEQKVERKEGALVEKTVTFEAVKPVEPAKKAARVTIIGEDMTVAGNLTDAGDIEIYGTVQGNVAGKNISIYGRVCGDVQGFHINLSAAAVQGNITAEGDVHMDKGSTHTDGVLKAKNLYSNGKIVCDMEVEELAHFEPLAHIEGNVSSKRLHIEEGAVVKGTLNCL